MTQPAEQSLHTRDRNLSIPPVPRSGVAVFVVTTALTIYGADDRWRSRSCWPAS